jgi:signal transduction histidine kinase
MTSRKVIAPVAHLVDQVDRSGPNTLPTDLSQNFTNDEVGILARALEQAMQRVESFVEREHQFTRDVSHELRTPVTVVKGAVELLKAKLQLKEPLISRPLARIERSVVNMENIIETLLWLSREDAAFDQKETFAVVPVARDTIEQNRSLIAEKSVEIEFFAESDPQLKVPAALFQIALTNLVRNAIQYTASGKISVTVTRDRIIVSDTGSGIAKNNLNFITQAHVRGDSSQGFGLGLSIVQRLCVRFDWNLKINSEVGQGTVVELIFQPDDL